MISLFISGTSLEGGYDIDENVDGIGDNIENGINDDNYDDIIDYTYRFESEYTYHNDILHMIK